MQKHKKNLNISFKFRVIESIFVKKVYVLVGLRWKWKRREGEKKRVKNEIVFLR